MKNNTFGEIGLQLAKAKSVLLYPHINMDGDCLGSSAALCHVLRNMGKECYIIVEDKVPANLAFLDKGYCTRDLNILPKADISMCIDCSDATRFPLREKRFNESPVSICIDHHETGTPFCQYNYINPDAAATAELIYQLILSMEQPIDKETGEAIFTGITTDTGNFQYSNTTKQTHEIAANLYDAGIDANYVSVQIYETVRPEKVRLSAKVMSTMNLFSRGRGVVAFVTQEMLRETGGLMEETEGFVEDLRSINSVEIAAFVKEIDSNTTKVSMRAKREGNVATIAETFGGGGHIKAAGFTLHCSVADAVSLIQTKIQEELS